jgi:dephospho-CoA kinase
VCRPEVQMARLIQRGLTEHEAQQRLDAQMPAAEKASRGNFVIETGGTMTETDRQVEELILKHELE